MSQRMIVPIDHGNRNMKTEHEVFTSGYVESDCKPVMGDYLFYNGKYYILSQQRIPYMKDKTADDRFFILTLFAIAMEAKRSILTLDTVLQVELPVGLPPKHYGALYTRFEEYFIGRGRQRFIYKGTEYSVDITRAVAYPQDYAAVMTQYGTLRGYGKLLAVDLGGLTLDYLMIREGKPDLSVCDSLEKGIIQLYNKLLSRLANEYDVILEESDIDSIIRRKKTDYRAEVVKIVRSEVKTYVEDILGTLRERGLDLKSVCVAFIGGASELLREYLEGSDRIGKSIFIDDICANAKGYKLLYELAEKKGR